MDPSKPGRAIANLEVILPKRVIEVSHLMKRQFEAVFDAANNDGNFSSKVKLFKDENDNVKINISLENLVLAGDRLCYHVLDVRPDDEDNLAAALAKPESANRRKPGRPRKQPVEETPESAEQKRPGRPPKSTGDNEDNSEKEDENNEDDEEKSQEPKEYGPGKRRRKKPARFSKEVELDTSQWSIVEGDEEDDDSSDEESPRDDTRDKNFVVPNIPSGTRGRGRPRKYPAKPPSNKPKTKRPNYKREQNLPCRICSKYYKDYLTLWGHVSNLHAEHPEGPDYAAELKELMKVKCKICGKILSNRRNEMVSHMIRVHGEDDGQIYECDECGKQFRREQLVKEHKRRAHPPHDRILCHLCPASFKLKEYLTEHLKFTHNKVHKWQCDICQKLLTSPKNLRRHKRLHGETAYSCNVCGRGFHELANMRRHMLYVHNPNSVERVKCPHCERDFSTRNNLIAHINGVHLKTSPYYCDICKKYFNRKKILLDHAQVFHPGVPILSTQEDGEPEEIDADAENVDMNEESTMVLIRQGNEGEIQTADGQTYTIMTMGDQTIDQNDTLANLVGSTGGEISMATAQQVLAALEAAGETGDQSYISVIGQGGEEIQVKVVQEAPTELLQEGAGELAVETEVPQGSTDMLQEAMLESVQDSNVELIQDSNVEMMQESHDGIVEDGTVGEVQESIEMVEGDSVSEALVEQSGELLTETQPGETIVTEVVVTQAE